MTQRDTSSAEFFEAKYHSAPDADPWKFATSEYELRRYDAVMQALTNRRYRYAFEPGCSVGVLTERLATLCDKVDSCDFSITAAAAAKARCEHLPAVTVRCAALTASEPWATFDLVVLCEIGYYFTSTKWKELVETMVLAMQPGAVLLASHWLGCSNDHIQSGDTVHMALQHPLLQLTLSERHQGFRLERWTRTV
jgi:cyclopropane fatty-acyl-phospholipid synthase-like methyltransferase